MKGASHGRELADIRGRNSWLTRDGYLHLPEGSAVVVACSPSSTPPITYEPSLIPWGGS